MSSQSTAPLLKKLKTTLKSIYNAKEKVSPYLKLEAKMRLVVDGVFSKIIFVQTFVCFFAISPNKPFFISWPSGC